MPSLLIVVNEPTYFLSHRLAIAEAARLEGFTVHIASNPGPAVNAIRQLGFFYHDIRIDRGGVNPFVEINSVVNLWRLVRKLEPDLLHLVTLKPVLYGGIAARVSKVGGVVAAIAGMGSLFVTQDLKFRALQLVIRSAYRLALGKKNLRVIFQNPDDREIVSKLASLPQEKAVIVRGSGVRLTDYAVQPEPAGRPIVVMATRLVKDKGVLEYVEAARLLKARGVDVEMRLIGSPDPGNPTTITEGELSEWGRTDVVELLGYRDNISAEYGAAHIVCLPSYREGLPKSLIEAAACGRPVVTTDVPGCRDAILPGITGVLVPVRSASALADAIQDLVGDPERRRTMGRAGRLFAEREFTIEGVVHQHMIVYRELLKQSRLDDQDASARKRLEGSPK